MERLIAIIVLFLISTFMFCANPNVAFAQDSTSDSDAHNDVKENWEHESALYRGFGWGLFGTGLLLGTTGIIVFAAAPAKDYDIVEDDDDDEVDVVKRMEPGTEKAILGLLLGGAALVITGSALLIADAVYFNQYRNKTSSFTWHPEFYLSPEMTGLGVSGRF